MVRVLVLQHMGCEGLGSLEGFFDKQGIDHVHVALHAGEKIPSDWDRYNGIVILGGPMNVYQEKEYPFLAEEDAIIKKALTNLKPMLGICLGAQLIAKAAGAKVVTGHRKEIGWYDVNLTYGGRDDLLFNGLPKSFKVFQWHGDTFNIPSKGTKLASSEIFPNQAFRVGNAYGLQFHIEVTESIILDWMKEYGNEIKDMDYIDSGRIVKDTKKQSRELIKLADKVYANFLGLVSR
jgi:GMP synthase (glutamine-hydrolysing)